MLNDVVEGCIECPFCGAQTLYHEQGDPNWESCKFYCFKCKESVVWDDFVKAHLEKQKAKIKELRLAVLDQMKARVSTDYYIVSIGLDKNFINIISDLETIIKEDK